jgi:predicted RNase H-like HicB family nuclease
VSLFGVPAGAWCSIIPVVKFYSFEILIEKEEDDEGYLAYSPTLPGCFSNGKTFEEARKNIREAIQEHVSSLLAHATDAAGHGP